jgi:hypothetical protein
MGQILSLPGVLLGLYGLYWSFKHKLPAYWPNGDETDDVADTDEADDDDDDDDIDDDDDDDDVVESVKPAEKSTEERPVDPDVEGEFDEAGRLKRRRDD